MNENESQGVRVVPVSKRYLASLHRCLDSVARERLFLAMVEAPPLKALSAFVQTNMADNAPYFIAILGAEVIGWCDIVPLRLEGFQHVGRLGVGVLRSHRRHGIAYRLIDRALYAAKQRQLERVELEVFASNAVAIKLYEKLGFKTEGIKQKARKIDARYDDVILMARFL